MYLRSLHVSDEQGHAPSLLHDAHMCVASVLLSLHVSDEQGHEPSLIVCSLKTTGVSNVLPRGVGGAATLLEISIGGGAT